MPKATASSLSPEVGRPLLDAAERISGIAPWEFMSDLELIGMRDDPGNLYVSSILGTLGTIFAVVLYRNDAGLRWIHDLATHRDEPDPLMGMEDLDYIKVEWCSKRELKQHDLKTLQAAGFKPKARARGPVWPRFESARPGWYPWSLDPAEAIIMTDFLRKLLRFIRLREKVGILHREPIEATVPIIPAGEEDTLTPGQIEWLPFIPRPPAPPEPVALSGEEEHKLAALPVRKDFIAELVAPLAPAFTFVDEKSGRPCLPRLALVVDRPTRYVLSFKMVPGPAPLCEAAGPALTQALLKANARPERLHVDYPPLAAALRQVCEAIRVPLILGPLEAAPKAFVEIEQSLKR